MEELTLRIAEKLGIPQDIARKAVLITADYLKEKLPQSLYSDVEVVLEIAGATDEETRELGLFRIPNESETSGDR